MTPASHFTHTPTADLTRIEDLTRREFMFSALGAALLIACGDDQDGDTASEDATRTINDVYGPVTVPAVPQRVVSFDAPTLTMLAALGVKPVGTYVNPLTGPPPGIDMAGVANVTAGESRPGRMKSISKGSWASTQT